MIKAYRYINASGTRSMWYLGSPTEVGIRNLLNSKTVVGIEWEYKTECEAETDFTVEGMTLKCENKDCDGSHSAFYQTRGNYDPTGYIEVNWTTPTDAKGE